MTDQQDDHNKIVSLFERHKRGEHFHFNLNENSGEDGGEMIISPDGFHYVSFKFGPDVAAKHEEDEMEMSQARSYVFKMLEHHKDTVRVNHYYVPGERLDEFLQSLFTRPGKLLEIKPYIADTMA